MVQMSGVLREVKANRYFVSKSEAARIKAKRILSEGGDRGIKQNRE